MRSSMRRLVIFGVPSLLGLVNLAHPVLAPSMPTHLFQTRGSLTIQPGWWVVTGGSTLAPAAVARPRAVVGLLTLAGALFGASHVPPTGPLGAACFLGAAVILEFGPKPAW
jgi:hypothetical protein